MRLSEKEYEDFRTLVELLRELDTKNYSYNNAVADFVGKKTRTLSNNLLSLSHRSITHPVFVSFCKKYKALTNFENPYRQSPEQALLNDLFKEWEELLEYRFANLEKEGKDNRKQVSSEKNKNEIALSQEAQLKKSQLSFLNHILTLFDDSVWHCYERYENHIGRNVFSFGQLVKGVGWQVTIDPADTGLHAWEGVARFLEGEKILDISSINVGSNDNYTHYFIPVDIRQRELELCVGHKTYKSNEQSLLNTTRVLLLKAHTAARPSKLPAILPLDSEEIEEPVRDFFQEMAAHHLSSPATSVHSLSALQHLNKQGKLK